MIRITAKVGSVDELMTDLNPRLRTHPGEILAKECLEPLGMTQHALAKKMRVSPSLVSKLISGERRITPQIAKRLAKFWASAQFWINLQEQYDRSKGN